VHIKVRAVQVAFFYHVPAGAFVLIAGLADAEGDCAFSEDCIATVLLAI